jgi:dynein heavy chain
LRELITNITSHPVLANHQITKDLENRHNYAKTYISEYEQEMTQLWASQDVSVADACLIQPVLAIQNDKLIVNLHPTIPLLIREAKCLAKMGIDLPIVATTLLCKQHHFDTICDSMNVRKKYFNKFFKSFRNIF